MHLGIASGGTEGLTPQNYEYPPKLLAMYTQQMNFSVVL